MTAEEPDLPAVWMVALRGALVGAAGGCIFGVLSGLAYFVSNYEATLPWLELGLSYMAYAVVSGALIAGCMAGAVALLDDFVGRRAWASPLPAAAIGGALGLTVPGAVGGGYFASMHAPFIGGIGMFAIPVVGTLLVAVALTAQDRALEGKAARAGATLAIALGAGAVFGGAIAGLALSVTDARMLEHLRAGASFFTPTAPDDGLPAWQHATTGLVIIGILAGVGLGGALGAYVGSVMSLARRLR